MDDDSGKKLKLTVFLVKEGIKDYTDFIACKDFNVLEVNLKNEIKGVLIYKGGFKSKPAWVDIFNEAEGFNSREIYNQSSKAIYAVQYEERWFCFTFGHSRHLINDLMFERDFGLKVTLNLADPESIKSIDKTNIGHISLHSKEQATKEIELLSFQFDQDIDLLKSVTATVESKSKDKEVVSGRDSVSIYTRIDLGSFKVIAEKLYKAYLSDEYKKRYPWIDKIKEERDKVKIEKLDLILLEKVISSDFQVVWLAIPEVISWEDVDGFTYKNTSPKANGGGPVIYKDVSIAEWCKLTKIDKKARVSIFKSRKVYTVWKDNRPFTAWSVYRCLNAEIDLDGEKYILNDGLWYLLDEDFVSDVSNFYTQVLDSTIKLPNYKFETEPDYLNTVDKARNDLALMDRKNILIGGGRSRVEFCDLFSDQKHIIHVKKYGGSSVLSHLFQQALVSGELFLHEPEFREKLNEKLPNGFKLIDTVTSPTPSEYEICLAIMSDVPGKLELPFFSKVSFKYSVKHLRNLGYKVTKLKIER